MSDRPLDLDPEQEMKAKARHLFNPELDRWEILRRNGNWHLDLDPEKTTGRHLVLVQFSDGTEIEGRLFYDAVTDRMRVRQPRVVSYLGVQSEWDGKAPPVLCREDDRGWSPMPDVKAAVLMYDEKVWDRIPLFLAREDGDMVVANGLRMEMGAPFDGFEVLPGWARDCPDYDALLDHVIFALRRKGPDRMGESARKTEPLLVSRKQARQLVYWAEHSAHGAGSTWVVKHGRFAYFTDNDVAVRWEVAGLDVPDGSWIDLRSSASRPDGGEPDTLRNMADWSQAADEDDCWDLKDAKRWREPAQWPRECEALFTRARTAAAPVALRLPQLTQLSLVVTGSEYGPVELAPTSEDGACPWWVMGEDKRVAGLCTQYHGFNPNGDDLPEAYQEKKEGESNG